MLLQPGWNYLERACGHHKPFQKQRYTELRPSDGLGVYAGNSWSKKEFLAKSTPDDVPAKESDVQPKDASSQSESSSVQQEDSTNKVHFRLVIITDAVLKSLH